MAITSAGYDGTVTETDWAKLMYGIGYGLAPTVVLSGLDASVGAGTRAVAVSAGSAIAPGVIVTSTAVETVAATANATGSTRKDWLALKFDWTANATTLVIVPGTTALPTLTQNAGVTWYEPLAELTVPNGASVISAANIVIRKRLPRLTRVSTDTAAPIATIGSASAGRTIASVTLTDPGWSYRLDISARARARLNAGDGAYGLVAMADGTQFGEAFSDKFGAIGDGTSCNLVDVSDPKTGATRVDLVVEPLLTSGSFELLTGKLIVRQIPV